MAIKKYKCTDKVGDWVLGIPKPKDGIVEFDDAVAARDVELGYLEEITEETAAPKKK